MLLINLKKLKTRTKNILKEQSNDGSTKRHFTNNITIKNTLVTAFILETKFIDKISYRYLKLLPGAKLLYNPQPLSLSVCMPVCHKVRVFSNPLAMVSSLVCKNI